MSDNIIFMGTSKFAVPILEKISESNLNISVVYTQPPKKSNRGMKIQKTPIHIKSELLGLPIRTPSSLKNNIDEYNFKFGLDIPYIDFRRNVVTKGIQLNELIGKKLKVGNVELEGIELCRPCRHLTEMLDQKNILKEFMRKGGLRCQILSSSKINIGDRIEVINN